MSVRKHFFSSMSAQKGGSVEPPPPPPPAYGPAKRGLRHKVAMHGARLGICPHVHLIGFCITRLNENRVTGPRTQGDYSPGKARRE